MRKNLTRALALAATVTAVFAVAPATVPSTSPAAAAYSAIGDCTPGSNWGTLRQDLASQVVQLVNQHRAARGLAQLQTTTPLTNSAIWKSRHMAYYGYMAHNDPAPPVARSVGDRLLVCGYPSNSAGWGENIAYGYGTANAVMQAWLNSPGHRQNIEDPTFRGIGVSAAAAANGTLYWTQQFGTSLSGGSTPPASASAASASAASATSGTGASATSGTGAPAASTSTAAAATSASGTGAEPCARVLQRQGRRLRRQDRPSGRPGLFEPERQQRVQLLVPSLDAPAGGAPPRSGVPRLRPSGPNLT